MKRLLPFVLLAILTFGLSSTATAAECADVKFPNSITLDGDKLQLNGLGLREATAFNVDVYVAALYVEKKSKSGSKLVNAKGKKRLILRFVRDVDKGDVRDAIKEGISKSKYGGKTLGAKAKKLSSWMGAVEEGDKFIYTYIPGKGVTFAHNGSTKGTIEGEKFAKALFDIWLGANPPNKGLKTGLLGGECD
ncbi:hypothetical protein FIV42_20290 [Persicimonas caeni]|uniref:Chalcone isomerase domain-containing protein n=1 Tax=Persicimonas caeni TaxID=2292766 RepID=A0A4Y6PXP4_PERCE|nr:chalcone isomerase family protein [Persicimonas caeni]QDG53000.1 hypothetical protein FIV42_20290 [Persicimonas caeni]QED34222.1 hypothetical protein FRD00_20285 [Persicimonas caeni]